MKLTALTTAALLTAALGWSIVPTIAGAADPLPGDQAEQAQPQVINEVTFLGIDTAPLSPDARQALDLKPGTALSIRSVGPGTPAAEAGLLPGDVLVKLNDQLIINGQQLAVLVRTFAPGDEIALHVLRDGDPLELKAKLAGRAVAPKPMIPRIPIQPMPNIGDIDALFERLRGPGVGPFGPGDDVHEMFDQMQRRMFEQRDEMQRMMDQMRDRLGERGVHSSVSFSDGEHNLQLRSDGHENHLTVKTLDGEVLFEGVLPEDGQVEGVPAEVQKKIDNLLKNNRIEFRMPEPRPQNREPAPIA
jgi:hypothetical protein